MKLFPRQLVWLMILAAVLNFTAIRITLYLDPPAAAIPLWLFSAAIGVGGSVLVFAFWWIAKGVQTLASSEES